MHVYLEFQMFWPKTSLQLVISKRHTLPYFHILVLNIFCPYYLLLKNLNLPNDIKNSKHWITGKNKFWVAPFFSLIIVSAEIHWVKGIWNKAFVSETFKFLSGKACIVLYVVPTCTTRHKTDILYKYSLIMRIKNKTLTE